MCGALGWYWLMRDRYADAVGWIERAETLPGAAEHPELVLVTLWTKVRAILPLGRRDEQRAMLERAEALARSLGDPALLARTLELRATHDMGAEDFGRANAWADEALRWAELAGDDWSLAFAAQAKAQVADTPEALRREVPAPPSYWSAPGTSSSSRPCSPPRPTRRSATATMSTHAPSSHGRSR